MSGYRFTDRVFGGFIHIKIAMTAGRISELWVGGSVVPVIDGHLRLP